MSDDIHDIHALSGAYAVDALDDVERARFERHLAGCTACQAEVAGLVAAAAEMSALTELSPPASLKGRVMGDIRAVRPLPPLPPPPSLTTSSDDRPTDAGAPVSPAPPASPLDASQTRDARTAPAGPDRTADGPTGPQVVPLVPRRRTLWRGLVAAATALVLAVGGFTVWRSGHTDPNQTIAEQVLSAADATRIARTLPDGAQATVVRSTSLHKAVLVTRNMPAAPEGKVYQLWLQDPTGHMASAGLMPAGADQVVVLDGDASKATGAGITVEPSGGSGQPTSDPVVLFAFA